MSIKMKSSRDKKMLPFRLKEEKELFSEKFKDGK